MVLTGIISTVSNDIVTDNRIHKISSSLEANGFQVTIIGRRFKNSSTLLDRPYRTHRFRLWFNKGPLFYVNLNIRFFFYLLGAEASIFLSNDLDTLPACCLAAKLKRKKLIFDSHELYPEVPELVDRPRVKKFWLFLEKLLIKRIDAGITVSESIANFYKEKYNVRFEVIRNVSRFRYDQEFTGVKKNSYTTILYQGALNYGRGIDLAIKSMQYIEDAKLWIIGSGNMNKKLRRLVSRLKLKEKVEFMGRVAFDDLWKYTPRADIGISIEEDLGLNYRYALPNKLFDYIQARIPVLISDLPEIKAIVEKYDIGKILKERSPRGFAALVHELIKEKSSSGEFNANRELAARELCWEREEDKLIILFKRAGKTVSEDTFSSHI